MHRENLSQFKDIWFLRYASGQIDKSIQTGSDTETETRIAIIHTSLEGEVIISSTDHLG